MKTLLKKILALFRLEINRRPISEEKKRQWIQDFGFKSVLDIGANQGFFALEIRESLPSAHIHCFEPLPGCFKQLSLRTKKDSLITCYNIGLGENDGLLAMNENDYTPSSSLLEMSELHVKNFPQTKHTTQTQVEIKRLDDCLKADTLPSPVLVKIDVQGFEDKVIKGGTTVLQKADAMIVEMSFVPLYQSQPLFHDIYKLLEALGFEYRGAYNQLYDSENGTILQTDGIFMKKNR
ncbi:MAG: FkbM family methyltransferase [Spirosomataceae bacterium]